MRSARSAKAIYALGATLIAGFHLSTADAETGSTVNGITQGGIQGITQGGVNGITQGGIQGITQGGVNGITQGGIQGITQGGVNGITQGGVYAFDNLVLSGPVDSIDPINGVFTAVGQTVMASQAMLSGMSVGDFVSVNGSVVTSGWLYADSISLSNEMYVPGATQVYVTGIPSNINPVLGQAELGELTIDYTAAMSSGAIPLGASLSFSGIQPVSRGLLVSDAVSAIQ